MLEQYKSPKHEYSIYKSIPMSLRESPEVLEFMKSGMYRIKYRGPRRRDASGRCSYSGRLTCLKKDATHFSIYERIDYPRWWV